MESSMAGGCTDVQLFTTLGSNAGGEGGTGRLRTELMQQGRDGGDIFSWTVCVCVVYTHVCAAT